MKLARTAGIVLAACSLTQLARAQRIVIDFEGLAPGEVITDQYPEATFSSTVGNANFALDYGMTTILCTGPHPGEANCLEDTLVDFTYPVNDLTLVAIQANFPGVAARIHVFEDGTYAGVVEVIGLGGTGNVLVDLSSFSNVTRIAIVDIVDLPNIENGIGWDDLSFTPLLLRAYCFGDGSGTDCPCGNPGGGREGCANSTGAGGVLGASGSVSVSSDDLELIASNLVPNQIGMCFVGIDALNGGDGFVFGDGLRCAGTRSVRLGTEHAGTSGAASWGPGLASQGGWQPGDERFFQVWYRDRLNGACGDDFNLTNGLAVRFAP